MRFRPKSVNDEEGGTGKRKNDDLIQFWKNRYKALGSAKFVVSRSELMKIDPDKTDFLLGKFSSQLTTH